MRNLPIGVLTLLFTDIEGSTKLVAQLGAHYAEVQALHRRILRQVTASHGGVEVDTQGDSFFFVFESASAAVAAALAAQQELRCCPWPEGLVDLRVRMGLHSGEPRLTEEGYVGLDVNRAARLCSAAHGGQVLISSASRELVRDRLPPGADLRSLGPHRLKDLARAEVVHQLLHDDLQVEHPPLRTLSTRPNNLPAQASSFIGREAEMARLDELLLRHRLVTIAGAGGLGKTRLALQVAADLVDRFPDGVHFVDYSIVRDPDLVASAMASALAIREHPGQSMNETLAEHLRARTLLMVLDNCEHLIDAISSLATELLIAAPSLQLLTTSRELLHVSGEVVFALSPLRLPQPASDPSPEALSQYEGVRLFIERAIASRSTFAVTAANAPEIAQICWQLDGLPLAIELAAARIRSLSAAQICARLGDRFALLTGGTRTAQRQQTLAAAIDWSHQLLDPAEQELFARLAVFHGGWDLEAAEAVAGDDDRPGDSVLDLLQQLVDKSLVVCDEGDDTPRFRYLETIHAYAEQRLAATTEAKTLRRRHLAWFLQFAELAGQGLLGAEQEPWLNRLDRNKSNLLTALSFDAAEASSPTASLRILGAIASFWDTRGQPGEGRKLLERALSMDMNLVSPQLQARALCGVGRLAWAQGDPDAGSQYFARSLAAAEAADDRAAMAAALHGQAALARDAGNRREAEALLRRSLTLRREVGDEVGMAAALGNLGVLAWDRGDYNTATALQEESLALSRGTGNARTMAYALGNLGLIAAARGELARALEWVQQSLDIRSTLGDARGVALSLSNLAGIALRQGDRSRARACLDESLEIRREYGERWGVVETLAELARMDREDGDLVSARRRLEECMVYRCLLHDEYGLSCDRCALALVMVAEGHVPAARELVEQTLRANHERGDKRAVLDALDTLAELELVTGSAYSSARLVGVVEQQIEALGLAAHTVDPDRSMRWNRRLAQRLDAQQLALAMAEGCAMPLAEAVDLALGLKFPPVPT